MARKHTLWSCVGTAFLFLAVQPASIKADGGGYYRRYSKTPLMDATGQNVGNAIIWSNRTSSLVHVNLRHLPVGEYVVTLHAGNTCTAPNFSSAKGPLNLSWKPEEPGDPGKWESKDPLIVVRVAPGGAGQKEEWVPHIGLIGARSVVGRTFIVTGPVRSDARKPIACGTIGPSS